MLAKRKKFNVGDAPLRVPQNGRVGGTRRGASPTEDCQREMKHAI